MRAVLVDPVQELRTYFTWLGQEWHDEWANGGDRKVGAEFAFYLEQGAAARDFYRESQTLLYHLTWFGMDRWKMPYYEILVKTIPPPALLIDYGCAIGADGLFLHEQGYSVVFADWETRCADYLLWRLAWRRELGESWWDMCFVPYGGEVPQGDVLLALDVLEHTPYPLAMVAHWADLADRVAFNLLKIKPDRQTGERLHYPHDPGAIFEKVNSLGRVICFKELEHAYFVIFESRRETGGEDGERTRQKRVHSV